MIPYIFLGLGALSLGVFLFKRDMTLRQLEALQYELETKDYSADDAG